MSQTIHIPIRIVSRQRDLQPNHHLFRNGPMWWCQITVHQGPTAERLRFSLKTRDLKQARRKRDRIFSELRPENQTV